MSSYTFGKGGWMSQFLSNKECFMKFLETSNFNWMELLNFSEQPFRAKLIPAKVWKDMDKYKNDSVGLANYVKKWRTRIEWLPKTSSKLKSDVYISVGGEYDPHGRRITISVYEMDFNKFHFTKASWIRFKFRFIQTLMHEMIHFMQFDRRDDQWSSYVIPYKKVGDKEKNSHRRYLSNFDEIQAYAHCVYLDFRMRRPTIDLNTLLKRHKKKKDSNTLHYFMSTFNYDFKHNPATKKIIQQIAKWDRKYSRMI